MTEQHDQHLEPTSRLTDPIDEVRPLSDAELDVAVGGRGATSRIVSPTPSIILTARPS